MSIALIVLIALVLVAPLAARRAANQWDIFEPYVFFAVAFGILFVVRPLYMMIANTYTYTTPLSATNVRPGFDRMLAVALVGATGFTAAYFLPSKRRARARQAASQSCDLARSTRAAAILAALGAGSLFAVVFHAEGLRGLTLVLGGRTSALSRAISDASFYPWAMTLMLVPAALVFLVLALERRQKRHWIAFLLTACFVGLRGVPEGDRAVLLLFCGGVLVVACLRRSARPNLLVVGALLVSAVYVSAFLSDLRGRSTRGESVKQTLISLSSHPGGPWTRLLTGPDTEMAPVLAAALEVIPSKHPYTYGATTFGDLVFRPVPRALWHAKPTSPRVRLISMLWPRDAKQHAINPEFSLMLYPYWDFGFIGVAVALAMYGVAARMLSAHSRQLRQHPIGQVFFALALWTLAIGVRDTPVETMIRAFFVIGPILVLMRLDRRTRALAEPPKTVNGSFRFSSEHGAEAARGG